MFNLDIATFRKKSHVQKTSKYHETRDILNIQTIFTAFVCSSHDYFKYSKTPYPASAN